MQKIKLKDIEDFLQELIDDLECETEWERDNPEVYRKVEQVIDTLAHYSEIIYDLHKVTRNIK